MSGATVFLDGTGLAACMNKEKREVGRMKKNIFPVITQFVVLVAPVSPNFASGVLAEEPAVKSFNRIPYPCGGFGIDERERLRSLTKGDNLELSFWAAEQGISWKESNHEATGHA